MTDESEGKFSTDGNIVLIKRLIFQYKKKNNNNKKQTNKEDGKDVTL